MYACKTCNGNGLYEIADNLPWPCKTCDGTGNSMRILPFPTVNLNDIFILNYDVLDKLWPQEETEIYVT